MQFSKDLQIIIFQRQNKNKLNPPLRLKVYTNGNFKHKKFKSYSIDFLNFTHAHIPTEAQTYVTLLDQNLKRERGGELTIQ